MSENWFNWFTGAAIVAFFFLIVGLVLTIIEFNEHIDDEKPKKKK